MSKGTCIRREQVLRENPYGPVLLECETSSRVCKGEGLLDQTLEVSSWALFFVFHKHC